MPFPRQSRFCCDDHINASSEYVDTDYNDLIKVLILHSRSNHAFHLMYLAFILHKCDDQYHSEGGLNVHIWPCRIIHGVRI